MENGFVDLKLVNASKIIKNFILENSDLDYYVTFTVDMRGFPDLDIRKVYKLAVNWFFKEAKKKGLKFILIPSYRVCFVRDLKYLSFVGYTNNALDLRDTGAFIVDGIEKPFLEAKVKLFLYSGSSGSRIKSSVFEASEWDFGYSRVIPFQASQCVASSYLIKKLGFYYHSLVYETFDELFLCSKFKPKKEEICLVQDDDYFEFLEFLNDR